MTKLSNVVGGLLRDLARSHAISDASTLEILDAYGRDAVLSQLPVPRLAVREAQLTIRFAVSAIQDEVEVLSTEELRDLWIGAMKDKVVPGALREIGRNDNKRVAAAFERVVERGGIDAEFDPALVLDERRMDELIKASHRFLVRQVATIADSTKRSLERLDVNGALERSLRDELPALLDAVRQLQQARAASRADLDVAITSTALAEVPEAQLSQLVLTISMEEVRRGAPGVAEVEG